MEVIHGREEQFKFLMAAFGINDKTNLTPCLFLWGQPSTGKTYVLNKAIQSAEVVQMARLSAAEIMCGRRPFFETLLRQLLKDFESESDVKCDNIRIFIRSLVSFIGKIPPGSDKRIVIIVDEAEHLRKEHPDIIDAFASLQDFTQGNICVVFSSSLPLTSFCSIPNMRSIPVIYFPQYSKGDIGKIITTCYSPEEPLDCGPEIYNFYVETVINVFYQGCRDFKKLLRLMKSNWNYFYQHYKVNPGQGPQKMWKVIEPRLKAEFKALNCHFVQMQTENKNLNWDVVSSSSERSMMLRKPNGATSTSTVRATGIEKNYQDIPKFSKYLLIASYLATHNPPTSDKRFFVKLSTQNRKKTRKLNLAPVPDDSEKTRALRSAELNRIKAIFSFIVHYCSGGTKVYEVNVDLLVQLSTLCQSRFIQALGEDSSGNFKYRCLADYDFMLEISKSVNFELEKYLYRLL